MHRGCVLVRSGFSRASQCAGAIALPAASQRSNPSRTRLFSSRFTLPRHLGQCQARTFSLTSLHFAKAEGLGQAASSVDVDALMKELLADKNLSDEEREQLLAYEEPLHNLEEDFDDSEEVAQLLDTGEPSDNLDEGTGFRSNGFFASGEGAIDTLDDPEGGPHDITTPAHFELEQQRELREFYRIMAWDMPLLYNLRQPWTAPKPKKQPLRFRYTTYLGETHPASKKVVLDFRPGDLPDLTGIQRTKLIKLLGPRYNPYSKVATMSAEYHSSAIQNKRHLAETLQKLLLECRDGTDTFEDVPQDNRHYSKARMPSFPRKWNMTPEKVARLAETRRLRLQDETVRASQGQLTDGRLVVERGALAPRSKAGGSAPVPVRVAARGKSTRQR